LTTVCVQPTENPFRGQYKTLYTPDTIHPVYWVDSVNGSNTNDGYSPRTPFASAVYALSAGRVTYGGRLQIVGGRLDLENAIIPVLNGNAREGDVTEFACIQGDGATKTSMVFASTATGSTAASFNSTTGQKLEFRDLSFKTEKAAINGVDSNTAASTRSHEFRAVRCILGDGLNSVTKFNRILRSSNCKMSLYGSIVEPSPSVSEGMLDTRTSGLSNYHIESSALMIGNSHIRERGTSNTLTVIDSDAVGAWLASLQIEAGTTFTKISGIRFNFWTAGAVSSVAVADLASLSWSGQLLSCGGNQARGVEAAFDGYSVRANAPIPNVNYQDYVY
jgi:hypothetical protein